MDGKTAGHTKKSCKAVWLAKGPDHTGGIASCLTRAVCGVTPAYIFWE